MTHLDFTIREFDDGAALDPFLPEWRRFVARPDVDCGLWCDPQTVRAMCQGAGAERLAVVEAAEAGRTAAVLPFRVGRTAMSLRVGLLSFGSIPVVMGKLVDSDVARVRGVRLPALVAQAMEMLGRGAGCDVVMAPNCPLPLRSSQGQRGWGLAPGIAARHVQDTYLVDVGGDFARYEGSLSPKSRQTLRRKVRMLERACGGRVAVRCYRAESDCDELGGHLVRVWRRSWHGKLGRQAPPEAAFLREMARLGRLRSYVLMAADAPAATVLGFQHRGTFMDEAPAYDEGWKKHSPGLVLSYLLLKDLFASDPPRQVDFGFGYNQYKEVLGTRGERRAELWLAVTPKGRAALRAARAGDWLFRAGKAALGRFGVVRRLKLAMKSE